jgi:hypothetical protein
MTTNASAFPVPFVPLAPFVPFVPLSIMLVDERVDGGLVRPREVFEPDAHADLAVAP